jgi:hypothetical protein
MTTQDTVLDDMLRELKAQKSLLATISNQLRKSAAINAPESPNYRRKLADYSTFDWPSIGAEVVNTDAQGVVEVEWNQYRFLRRSGTGKFGKAIWFSRATGQGENGAEYARLITFKDYEPEPLAAGLSQG